MRHPLLPTILAAVVASLLAVPAWAQGRSEQLPGGFRPPPPAPVKPYAAVAVTLPKPLDDPGFVAFRKQLGEVAQHKDRAALGKLTVAQGFFWMMEPGKNEADKRKSAIDNLAKATDLDAKDGGGWELLSQFANEPTASSVLPDRPSVLCAPAIPHIDPKAFQALVQSTQTSPMDWVYPVRDGVEVRGAAKADAPVVDKLGMNLVRALPDTSAEDSDKMPPFLHVATPSGKTGFVATDDIGAPADNELCYAKDASGWKITGFLGGGGED
jgi:hypothetical protein